MCTSVLECKNLIASHFTKPLQTSLVWEEEKCRFLEVCAYVEPPSLELV